MSQQVISSEFPYLLITLSVRERTEEVTALLDTGFDGYVVVPPGLITNGKPPDSHIRWTLADGSSVQAPSYLGTVRIGDFAAIEAVITVLGDEPIVGRSVTDRYNVTLDHGQRVLVEL